MSVKPPLLDDEAHDPIDTLRWALVPLRITIAIGFVMHGESKLVRGPEHFAHILEALGVPMSHVAAWLTILVEIIGGVSLLLGAYREAGGGRARHPAGRRGRRAAAGAPLAAAGRAGVAAGRSEQAAGPAAVHPQ
ncbi:MAG TPA: DoxX family protein, partial [Kofleriaceae bacterium]